MAVGADPKFPLPPVGGVRLSAARAGIRKSGAPDLVLIETAPGSQAAAVFTRNAFCAAPVRVAREHLQLDAGAVRCLMINAGNANAGTGDQGIVATRRSCAELARLLELEPSQILPFSTGVIGEPLPVDKLIPALPAALSALDADAWETAARGIMTTDTRPKGAFRQLDLNGGRVTVCGIAKGAGMIRPDMATMLSYIATDAAVPAAQLQDWLVAIIDRSFNAITVDGDTSTNDSCVLLATGAAGVTPEGEDEQHLFAAIEAVATELAQAIVRDAEGATKFVTIEVTGAANDAEARRVGFTVAESPLVKTALFASDPNWGRVLAAVGRAGLVELAVDRINIDLDEVRIVAAGARAPDYAEERGQAVMDRDEICIRIMLGRGSAAATVWTCDLSTDYVRINAEYRS